jgi:hypothetical protein
MEKFKSILTELSWVFSISFEYKSFFVFETGSQTRLKYRDAFTTAKANAIKLLPMSSGTKLSNYQKTMSTRRRGFSLEGDNEKQKQKTHIADCLKYHRERAWMQIKNSANRSDNNLRYHMAAQPRGSIISSRSK